MELDQEKAVARAMKFAGLKAVSSVKKSKINYSHTQYYLVTGVDDKGRLQIGIDPQTGEIVRMIRLCPFPGLFVREITFDKEMAVKFCMNFLKERQLPMLPKGYTMEVSREKEVMKQMQYKVVFRHYEEKIPVATDFISFVLNGIGEVVSYSKVHHDIKVSTSPRISREEAHKLASEILGKEKLKGYPPESEILDVSLKIVYPNQYFRKWIWEWSEEQALVWVVKFGKKNTPELDVWVDANSGIIQGGEIYERPIPELIGIPDQTGDITGIWQPAMDVMKFNTGTTNTILGDTTEADVVDAIENGFVFVLQTHGDTTATAERAIISHTGTFDERNLTPDEVPDNDLYYALVSCCESGNDGTGADFKDTFIDQGALSFQGYHPSINPDPYERRLVRYMAEGECLQNAHFLADADINPWFDIIIEWQAWCWNAIYLAPLKVSLSAPSTAGCSFTISATIYNGEAALATTANDVYAYLELPTGFTLTSGPILQNTPSITFGSSWTATWTVSAPLFAFGEKTFDVIVWSDNLGVAVHDFDNPYHKFNINLRCLHLIPVQVAVLKEVFRWWEWASEIYPKSTTPKKILEHRNSLSERYRHEYFFLKDPNDFFESLFEIDEYARIFAREAAQQKSINRNAFESYMKALDELKAFLTTFSRTKNIDTDAFFQMLGKYLVAVNEKAILAFSPKLPKE